MATDQLIARDAVIRQAAFDHVRGLQSWDLVLSHDDIRRGFVFEGERWPLWNPQRGIFKPRETPFLLSIRTVPEEGRARLVRRPAPLHQQIYAGEEELDYAFMGKDPEAAENVWLREAAEHQIPLIYFLGVSPGRYQAIVPTFVVDWDSRRLTARIAFGALAGATARATAPDPVERRYALLLVKQRLHQASFRDSVLAAYDHRCTISNLPDDRLLDAAHIMADAHERLASGSSPTASPSRRSPGARPPSDRACKRLHAHRGAATW
jgi:putative restriction endonuclease